MHPHPDPTPPSPAAATLRSPLLRRQDLFLRPEAERVVVRPFRPTTEPRDLNPTDKARANRIVGRVLALDPAAAERELAEVLQSFAERHRNLLATFELRADEMEDAFAEHATFSRLQRQLVGAYFLLEYSFEASALFNPSIVADPDQAGASPDGRRFILSLRAVGEGHVSSLTFRGGTIDGTGTVTLDPTAPMASIPAIQRRRAGYFGEEVELIFDPATPISERVIFPVTGPQSNGIEDARFVAFDDVDRTTYYATYTAYSGRAVRSELLQTDDFTTFQLLPLAGAAAQNKGMALFPRRIDGRFAMIARQDNENLYLVVSDDIRCWDGGTAILRPRFPWEFVQIGNCGSPIELDEGWLLLTHGVGPLRKYAIGAALLDKHAPGKVLARSHEPLIRPEGKERNGYVPNVVYTCGAMRHGSRIILPFAISDTFSTFASFEIADLLATMTG